MYIKSILGIYYWWVPQVVGPSPENDLGSTVFKNYQQKKLADKESLLKLPLPATNVVP